MPMTRKLGAEFIGTFWLVLGGRGPPRGRSPPYYQPPETGITPARTH
jgi:hypothetical protein